MRTLDATARALLKAAKLSVRFWPSAKTYAMWLKNRLPHAGIDFATPYQLMFGKAPANKDIIKLSLLVFVIDIAYKLKFDVRLRPAIFLCCPENVKGYRVYLIDENRMDNMVHIYLSKMHMVQKSKQAALFLGDEGTLFKGGKVQKEDSQTRRYGSYTVYCIYTM